MAGSKIIAGRWLELGWLVLIALVACEKPNIPARRVQQTEVTAAETEMPPRREASAGDDDDEPGGDSDIGAAEPDAGADEQGAVAVDDAVPGTNANAPTAGQGGAGTADAGGGAGAGAGGAVGADAAVAPDPMTAPDPDAELIGFWTGHVVDILGPMFDLCMTITQVGTAGVAGTTSYFNGTTCGGELSYIEKERDTYSFGERITWGGPCIPAGRIDMRLNSDGTLDWEWFRSGAEVPQETGTMERVDGCPD